jgi:hypothetical protein
METRKRFSFLPFLPTHLFSFNTFGLYDGFGGLVVSMLASGSRVRGFDLDQSRWIFSDVKKSSACLPLERK